MVDPPKSSSFTLAFAIYEYPFLLSWPLRGIGLTGEHFSPPDFSKRPRPLPEAVSSFRPTPPLPCAFLGFYPPGSSSWGEWKPGWSFEWTTRLSSWLFFFELVRCREVPYSWARFLGLILTFLLFLPSSVASGPGARTTSFFSRPLSEAFSARFAGTIAQVHSFPPFFLPEIWRGCFLFPVCCFHSNADPSPSPWYPAGPYSYDEVVAMETPFCPCSISAPRWSRGSSLPAFPPPLCHSLVSQGSRFLIVRDVCFTVFAAQYTRGSWLTLNPPLVAFIFRRPTWPFRL